MLAAVAGDVGQRAVHPIHHGDGQGGVEPFGAEVGLGRRGQVRQDGAGAGVGAEAAAQGGEVRDQQGQQGGGAGGVDQQRFGGAADAGAAHLGVGEHGAGHGRVGGGVDVGVAQALGMGEDGHAGVALHPVHQGAPAAGDHEVDQAAAGEQGGDVGAVGARRDLHGVPRQAGGVQALGDGGVDGLGGARAVRSAAQDGGVARLHAQPGGIGAHVRAALVDHADDAQGLRNAADAQAIGPGPVGQGAGEGVGQGGDAVQALRHGLDPGRGQGEAVAEGRGALVSQQVGLVGGQDRGGMGAQPGGGGGQPGGTVRVRRAGQDGGGGTGAVGRGAEPGGGGVGVLVHCKPILPGRGRARQGGCAGSGLLPSPSPSGRGPG